MASTLALGFSAGARVAEKGKRYPPRVVARCLDGIPQDSSVDCATVLASVPAPKTSRDISIPRVQKMDPSCPPPTTLEGGDCVLAGNTVLTETLWLSSGTTLDCKGHELTPATEGQSASWKEPSVPSIPNTAVLLAGQTVNVTVKNCKIRNFDFGIVIANSKPPNAAQEKTLNHIVDNELINRYRGVEIVGSDGNEVSGNTIHSFAGGSGGVGITHDADDNLIKGNSYVGPSVEPGPAPALPGAADDWVWSGEAVRVQGPIFSYNFRVGDRLFVGTLDPHDWAERNIIEANEISVPTMVATAIVAESRSDRTTIRGNTVHEAGDAIYCVSHANGLEHPDGPDPFVWSLNVLVEGNTIVGPVESGVLTAATLNPILRDNTIKNATVAGMIIIFPHNATITRNEITDSASGLLLFAWDSTTSAFVSENNIFGNGLEVDAELVESAELSVNGVGNFWGHSTAPGWLPSDTNEPSLVTDSHPSLVPFPVGSSD